MVISPSSADLVNSESRRPRPRFRSRPVVFWAMLGWSVARVLICFLEETSLPEFS